MTAVCTKQTTSYNNEPTGLTANFNVGPVRPTTPFYAGHTNYNNGIREWMDRQAVIPNDGSSQAPLQSVSAP